MKAFQRKSKPAGVGGLLFGDAKREAGYQQPPALRAPKGAASISMFHWWTS